MNAYNIWLLTSKSFGVTRVWWKSMYEQNIVYNAYLIETYRNFLQTTKTILFLVTNLNTYSVHYVKKYAFKLFFSRILIGDFYLCTFFTCDVILCI